jgi:hypothetical protein
VGLVWKINNLTTKYGMQISATQLCFISLVFILFCSLVIMEGNPHPGAVKGRISFGSFNPSIDVSFSLLAFSRLTSVLKKTEKMVHTFCGDILLREVLLNLFCRN